MQRPDFVVLYVMRQLDDQWHVLQLKRAPDRYLGNAWQFPAGKLEEGETSIEAALRELREETGLEPDRVQHLTYVPTFFMPARDAIASQAAFCVFAAGGIRLNEEHTDFRWLSRCRLHQDVLWPTDRRALAEVWREHLPGASEIASHRDRRVVWPSGPDMSE